MHELTDFRAWQQHHEDLMREAQMGRWRKRRERLEGESRGRLFGLLRTLNSIDRNKRLQHD